MHHLRRSLLWLTLFSISMGFLESSVVIYLRALYYPTGFVFPLVLMPHTTALVELFREASTILMLASIGIIAGRNAAQRFSFFIYSFAVWDLFYYVFLKVVLDWPDSLMTWDILFLIPVPWVGPVLAPCIVAATMILLTLIVIFAAEKDNHVEISILQWTFLVSGGLVIILSFIRDYLQYIRGSRHAIWTPLSRDEMFIEISHYIPQYFNWYLFVAGEILLLVGIASIYKTVRSKKFLLLKK